MKLWKSHLWRFVAQLLSNSWENLLCKSLTAKIVKIILVFTIVEAHKSISSSFDDVFLWKFVSPQRHPLLEKLKEVGTLHHLFQLNSLSSAKHFGCCVISKYGTHNCNCSANFILKFFPCFLYIPHAALLWICFRLWSDIYDWMTSNPRFRLSYFAPLPQRRQWSLILKAGCAEHKVEVACCSGLVTFFMFLAINFGLAENVSRNIFFQPEPKTNSKYSQSCRVWDIRKTREELADEVCKTILFVHAILNWMWHNVQCLA